MVQDGTAEVLLVRLIEECRSEVLAEWRALLADRGLPSQQRKARSEPAAVEADFDQIMRVAVALYAARNSKLASTPAGPSTGVFASAR